MRDEFTKKIWPFNIVAGKLYCLIHRSRVCESYFERLKEDLKVIYPQYESEEILKRYVSYKIMNVLVFLFALILLFLVYSAVLRENNFLKYLEREDYMGEDVTASIVAKSGNEEIPIDIDVFHQEISKEEMQNYLETVADKLPDMVLGDNESLDKITSDLKLITQIPDTQIDVYWELEENEVVMDDGTLVIENLNTEGTLVKLTATLCWEDAIVVTEFYGNFVIPELTSKELFKINLLKKISQINESSVSDTSLILPEEVDGVSVQYKKNEKEYSVWILLICVPLIFFLEDEKLKKKKNARRDEMLVDYPEIVNKIILYLGAGLSIQGAFELIANNYQKNKKNGERKAAYEEIVFMNRQVQGGISFHDSMEHFSRRCQVQPYRKLSLLLLQNLKKGSNELIGLLRQEAVFAFEERKNLAKRLGEEAGTKMLIPMVIMLGIVIVILIVPAWFSFQI